MGDEKILLLNKNYEQNAFLSRLVQGVGPVETAQFPDEAASLAASAPLNVLIVEQSLANSSRLKESLSPKTSLLIIGESEAAAREIIKGWPSDYFIDFAPIPSTDEDKQGFLRAVKMAAEYSRLKYELERISSQKLNDEKFKEVYSEIK